MFKAAEEVVKDDVHLRVNLYDHGFLLTIKTRAGSFPHAQLNRKLSLTQWYWDHHKPCSGNTDALLLDVIDHGPAGGLEIGFGEHMGFKPEVQILGITEDAGLHGRSYFTIDDDSHIDITVLTRRAISPGTEQIGFHYGIDGLLGFNKVLYKIENTGFFRIISHSCSVLSSKWAALSRSIQASKVLISLGYLPFR
jgi:hypothetical protein